MAFVSIIKALSAFWKIKVPEIYGYGNHRKCTAACQSGSKEYFGIMRVGKDKYCKVSLEHQMGHSRRKFIGDCGREWLCR